MILFTCCKLKRRKRDALHAFFISNTLISNSKHKLAENQVKSKNHLEAEFLLFESYSFHSSKLSSKNDRKYSKKICKNKWVSINDIIGSGILKTRLKMKNRSHRYDINRPRPRHGYKYAKYKMCHSTMMVICIKQHLRNI